MYASLDQIVSKELSILTEEDKEYFREIEESELYLLRFYAMYIRNTYGLWLPQSPLTKEWHDRVTNKDRSHVIDGVDNDPYHPDAVSYKILKMIWAHLKEIDDGKTK